MWAHTEGVQWGLLTGGALWDAQGREQEVILFLGAFCSVFQFAPCPLALGTILAWLKLCAFKLWKSSLQ